MGRDVFWLFLQGFCVGTGLGVCCCQASELMDGGRKYVREGEDQRWDIGIEGFDLWCQERERIILRWFLGIL